MCCCACRNTQIYGAVLKVKAALFLETPSNANRVNNRQLIDDICS